MGWGEGRGIEGKKHLRGRRLACQTYLKSSKVLSFMVPGLLFSRQPTGGTKVEAHAAWLNSSPLELAPP